jgi:hypothetical protein
MKYTDEIAPNVMICIRNFMKSGSDIQVILKLLPWQSEGLQCWYY